MFTRFIVATDLSPASFAVVGCLGGLAAFGARHCLLLQCLDLQEAASTALSYSTDPLEDVLRQQKESLEAEGYQVETRIVPGFAKREINRIAEEEDYALIVVGALGQSMVHEALLGGIATQVIHSARKPVLVVRLEPDSQTGEVRVCPSQCNLSTHVLFPTDFSENADHAFTYLEHLVASGARRVTLLHVQDRTRIDPHLAHRLEEFNAIDRGRLTELRERLTKAGDAAVEIGLDYGSPASEIVDLAGKRDVHLIVMGSQGRGFIQEAFLGSVSHHVARHASAPVLLIPALRKH